MDMPYEQYKDDVSEKAIELMKDFVASLDFTINDGIITMTSKEIDNFISGHVNINRNDRPLIKSLFEMLLSTINSSQDENYVFTLDTFDYHEYNHFYHKELINTLIEGFDLEEVPLFVIYDNQDLLKEYVKDYKPYTKKLSSKCKEYLDCLLAEIQRTKPKPLSEMILNKDLNREKERLELEKLGKECKVELQECIKQ